MHVFKRRLRPWPLVLLGTLTLTAQDDIAERLFRSGERAYATQSYAEALETWQQLLQQAAKSPFAPQALLAMARHQLDVEKKPEAALPILERIKNEHIKTPQAAEAMLLRGIILAEKSRNPQEIKEAIAEFNRLVDLCPDHPAVQNARFQLGLACLFLRQHGRALQHFLEAMRLDPVSAIAPKAQLHAAETLDALGDVQGCLRLLQGIRDRWPKSPEASEATWRAGVRVKQRMIRPPLVSAGPWPDGRKDWLKTPTLLSVGPKGELFVYQNGLDQAFALRGQLAPVGVVTKNAKAMVVTRSNDVWLVVPSVGVIRSNGQKDIPIESLSSQASASLGVWGDLWIADAKTDAITVFAPDGSQKKIPLPAVSAIACLQGGCAVAASDENRVLSFLDASQKVKLTIPYGQGLPGPFREIRALCSDELGHVAALVEGGDFEGVVLWGPDGTLLRHATYKSLGISGKFRSLALDREGAIILADRSNDILVRLN